MTRSGVLVVNKPRGPTSHDVVAQARRLYGTRGVGHAGTLDPLATGVLVLLVGEATKLSGYLSSADKEYRATVAFGRSTDTLDAEGATVAEARLEPGWLDGDALDAALTEEAARRLQIPPAFSAISVDGERAHRRARRGKDVTLVPRPVEVHAIARERFRDSELVCRLSVSKGYYVRAFARDLGERLGAPAHLAALERLASGPFRLEEAVAWPPEGPPGLLRLAPAVRRSLPVATLTEGGSKRARFGLRLDKDDFAGPCPDAPVSAWVDPSDALVALGRPDGNDGYRVVRGFTRDNPINK